MSSTVSVALVDVDGFKKLNDRFGHLEGDRCLREVAGAITESTRGGDRAFRWGEGQNLLREALLIADHNAYHLAEIVVIRRLLGCWPK